MSLHGTMGIRKFVVAVAGHTGSSIGVAGGSSRARDTNATTVAPQSHHCAVTPGSSSRLHLVEGWCVVRPKVKQAKSLLAMQKCSLYLDPWAFLFFFFLYVCRYGRVVCMRQSNLFS